MIQADKDLLLKDLCCRLPYGVKASTKVGGNIKISFVGYDTIIGEDGDSYDISFITPYLFPLSSMTDEQSKELDKIDPEFYSLICSNGELYVSMDLRGYDWLNENHFDYRGLIPKGLALNATGLNIY